MEIKTFLDLFVIKTLRRIVNFELAEVAQQGEAGYPAEPRPEAIQFIDLGGKQAISTFWLHPYFEHSSDWSR